MSRPRNLSAGERALWDSVAKQAKPLKKKRAAAKPRPPTPAPSPPQLQKKENKERLVSALPAVHGGEGSRVLASKTTKSLRPKAPLATLDRREKSRLARGHRDIDARIDLHGMTQARAHRALLGFLLRAQDDGCRYVLVITGKGKMLSDGTERGVLRRQVPEWLGLPDFHALVTGYEEAAISHGGAGALYVRVRRG